MRRASCSCGQLTVDVEGDPIRVSVCHCRACQRRTGSAFGAQARFARDAVTITGESRTHVRVATSGNTIDFSFCPECGSTVHYAMRSDPNVIAIAIGAFADPTFPAPTFSVYEDRQHPWVRLEGEMEHWD